jgi:hypothetical protein
MVSYSRVAVRNMKERDIEREGEEEAWGVRKKKIKDCM